MGLSPPAFFCFDFPMIRFFRGFKRYRPGITLTLALVLVVGWIGCSPGSQRGGGIPVVLQTDWFPQPEQGGFYQALAKGYYQEAGLDVRILPGGPNAMSTQKVLKGTAHFAMNRADTIYSLFKREVPILMVMATLQHDPQALLLHQENPINSLAELDGQRVMAVPGLSWIRWLEAKYDLQLEIIPHDFGLQRFLHDPSFIQQCLLTNEPFYVRQAGVVPKVLPLRESGFDPYHGIYCLQSYAAANPDVVRRFVEASMRGWKDYILGDPSPAFALIAERNPKMNRPFMAFSYAAMKADHLVTGDSEDGGQIGRIDSRRMRSLVNELHQLGIVEGPEETTPSWYTERFLVNDAAFRPADEPSGGPP